MDPIMQGAEEFLRGLEDTHFAQIIVAKDLGGGEEAPVLAIPSSFGYLTSIGAYLYVYGGSIRWSGRASFNLAEGTDPDDSLNPNAALVVGMTEGAPGCVCLKMDATYGPASTELVFITAQNPPDDDGTFFYKPLCEAYLDAEGNAVFVKDRRPDWCMGSPI